jgi:hypothetical protein
MVLQVLAPRLVLQMLASQLVIQLLASHISTAGVGSSACNSASQNGTVGVVGKHTKESITTINNKY